MLSSKGLGVLRGAIASTVRLTLFLPQTRSATAHQNAHQSLLQWMKHVGFPLAAVFVCVRVRPEGGSFGGVCGHTNSEGFGQDHAQAARGHDGDGE